MGSWIVAPTIRRTPIERRPSLDERPGPPLAHRFGRRGRGLTVFDLRGGTELAALTMLMPVVYLGAAALDRRRFAWVVLLAGVRF
jgi:hypothetical protein